jgi:hypothetical protein
MLEVIKIHIHLRQDKNMNRYFANIVFSYVKENFERIKAIEVEYERHVRVTFLSFITLFFNYTVWEKHKQLIMVDYTHFVFGQQ